MAPQPASYTVWLYHVFCLSLRDVELLLAERGVVVTHESVRHWCRRSAARSLTGTVYTDHCVPGRTLVLSQENDERTP
jgi:transposase-like protein